MSAPTANRGIDWVQVNTEGKTVTDREVGSAVWDRLRSDAAEAARQEPTLKHLLEGVILHRGSFEEALSYRLARKLCHHAVTEETLTEVFMDAFRADVGIVLRIENDLRAFFDRDPACPDYLSPFLYFKGFMALSGYRLGHFLWESGRFHLAYYLQSIISEEFAVDIHPAARIASGILVDHATSIVIGETAVVEENVSILHDVTLGGTGKETGDRHPKVRAGVLIGAGAKIIGNVEIGTGAKIGAGSVVLNDVPPHSTVVGVPAEVVGKTVEPAPALDMDHKIG